MQRGNLAKLLSSFLTGVTACTALTFSIEAFFSLGRGLPKKQSSSSPRQTSMPVVAAPSPDMDAFEAKVFDDLVKSDMVAAPVLHSLEEKEDWEFLALAGEVARLLSEDAKQAK